MADRTTVLIQQSTGNVWLLGGQGSGRVPKPEGPYTAQDALERLRAEPGGLAAVLAPSRAPKGLYIDCEAITVTALMALAERERTIVKALLAGTARAT